MIEIKKRLYKGPGSELRVMDEIRKKVFGSYLFQEKAIGVIYQALFGRDADRFQHQKDIPIDDLMLAFP